MLRLIVVASLQFRYLVLAGAVALVLVGGMMLPQTRFVPLSEFEAPMVEVQTEALGLSAGEVEDLVTINLEEILTATPFLKTIHSKSVPGLASVLLTFEDGTDPVIARQMVQERLTMAWALPNVSKPPTMLQPKSAAGRAMMVGLTSKTVSLIDMSVLARWTMTPKLLSVPGVANVAIWGQRERQLQVQIQPRKLQANGVTLEQVIKSTGDSLWVSPLTYLESSILGSSGWIDTPNQRLGIQHIQPISEAADLSKVAIAESALTLGDVATVVENNPPLIGDALVEDQPGIILVIEKLPNADAKAVVAGLETALAELGQGMSGIEIDSSIYRSSDYIGAASANLGKMLMLAGVLMAAAVFLSFRAIKPAVVAIVVVVLSYAAALIALLIVSPTVNLIHVVGLAAAFCIVVSSAVSAAEAILRHAREDAGSRPVVAAVFDAIGEIRQPLVFALLIGLLAVMPIAALNGEPAAFFWPMAQSYGLTLIALLAVTVLAAPGLAVFIHGLGASAGGKPEKTAGAAEAPMLARFSASAMPAYVVAVAGALAVLAAMPLLKWSFVPPFTENTVRISFEAPPGTSLPAMNRIIAQLGAEVRTIPGIRSTAGHIGRAITGDQVVGIESGQIWTTIDGNADRAATVAAIRDTVSNFPNIQGTVGGYLSGTADKIFVDPGDPIVVRIEGAETSILEAEAKRVAGQLAKINGVSEVRIDEGAVAPEVRIKVDVAAAAKHGLKPGDIRRTAATMFAGLEVGNLFEKQKVFNVVVWGAPDSRSSVSDIENLLIEAPDRTYVRLGDVAQVNVVSAPRIIEREGVTRSIDIHVGVAGRSVSAVSDDVRGSLKTAEFPFEYHAYLRGDPTGSADEHIQLWMFTAAAAILIFFLLQAAVQSWWLAVGTLLSLLAALLGGVAVIVATGGTAGLGSALGLIAVFGLATHSGLVLVSRVHMAATEHGASAWRDSVKQCVRERFRPTLTSAAITILAFLPATIMGSNPGLEILHQMGLVVIGGTITAVLVNLFVLPSLLVHSTARPQPMSSEGADYAAT